MACLLLTLMLTLGALAGCAGQQTEKESFTLSAAVCGSAASLDPARNADEAAESVFYALYENLLRMSDDGAGGAAVVPGVAKEYKSVTNYDGTVDYVFTLRSSARWSDGTHVKARDFVYAWRRLVDPETNSPHHALLSMVKGYDTARETGETAALAVSARGDTTFCVTLAAPCPYFLERVCTAAATMPLRSDVVTKDPAGWASSVNLVSNGAYQVGVWKADEYLQLRRSAAYYESKLVGPDILRFVFAKDAEEAYRLYEEGTVDYVPALPEGAAAQLIEAGQTLPADPLSTTCCVLYNHEDPLFSDEHVRRAFDLAIDRMAAAAAAAGMPATGFVPQGVPNGTEDGTEFRTAGGALCGADTEGYAERCAQAVQELERAGYEFDGTFPQVQMLYAAEEGTSYAAAAALAAMWEQVLGTEVTLEGLPREDFDARLTAGEYQLAADTFRVPDGDVEALLARFAGSGEENVIRYANGTYDILLGVVRASESLAARAAFLHDAEAMMLDDAALSPVYFGGTTHLLRAGLQGVYRDCRGTSYLQAVTHTAAEQK